MIRRQLRRTALIVVVLASPLWLAGCGSSTPPDQAKKSEHGHGKIESARDARFAAMMGGPLKVNIITPKTATVPITMTAAGTLASPNAVTITPQVSGTISAVHARSGQQVRKGALLFTLDDQPFRSALRSAEAKRAGDAAQLRYAEQQVNQLTPLVKKEYVTRQSFDQAVATANAARAQLAQDDAAIETARINLAYTEIRAPIDGRLGEISLQPGNLVVANSTALTTLISNRRLLVNFSLPQAVLTPLRTEWPGLGQAEPPRSGEAPAITILDEQAEKPLGHGFLSFVDNSISSNTGTIRLQGTIDNAEGTLWPGQFVTARLTLGKIPDAQIVPAAAVQLGDRGAYLYVLKDGKAEMMPVTPARTEGTQAILPANSLPAGTEVIFPLPSRIAPGSPAEKAEPVTQTTPAIAPGAHRSPHGGGMQPGASMGGHP